MHIAEGILMDWNKELYDANEKPLDRLIETYSNTAIFRTVAFIGDSLSSGEFETHGKDGVTGYHDMFEYSWGQYIARKNGLKAYNFSRGGMTARQYIQSFAQENGLWDPEKACQAYVIALGVNDILNENREIGSLEDIDAEDCSKNKPTFIGYYAAIVSRYKQICPDAKFFFVTFPKGDSPEQEVKAQGMVKALYDLAGYFDHSYVIDLYQYGPVHDRKFKEKYYLYGHLNPSGYILTAKIIDSYIDYIVRHHPAEFKSTAFINTDICYQ